MMMNHPPDSFHPHEDIGCLDARTDADAFRKRRKVFGADHPGAFAAKADVNVADADLEARGTAENGKPALLHIAPANPDLPSRVNATYPWLMSPQVQHYFAIIVFESLVETRVCGFDR
jgi:hypothetical protein